MYDETFVKTVEVEKHMEAHHHAPKTTEFPICKKTFILEWRLKKHAAIHTIDVVTVARLDDFRTRKWSNLDDFRALNASNLDLFRLLIA